MFKYGGKLAAIPLKHDPNKINKAIQSLIRKINQGNVKIVKDITSDLYLIVTPEFVWVNGDEQFFSVNSNVSWTVE